MTSMELGLQVLGIHPCNSASPEVNLEKPVLILKGGRIQNTKAIALGKENPTASGVQAKLMTPHGSIFPYLQFSLVTQSYPTLCDTMDYSIPGFPVCYQLPEIPQTHVHPVGDATQPSHPLSPPSPAFNLYQPQGLFQCVGSSH